MRIGAHNSQTQARLAPFRMQTHRSVRHLLLAVNYLKNCKTSAIHCPCAHTKISRVCVRAAAVAFRDVITGVYTTRDCVCAI